MPLRQEFHRTACFLLLWPALKPDRSIGKTCLRRALLVAMLFLSMAWQSLGQSEDAFLASHEQLDSPWRIRSFTDEAGLTRRNIFGLASDNSGSVWVAGSDGVYFSDGYHWKRYTTADGLPTDFIRSVFVSASGQIWVGTAKGVATFEKGRFKVVGSPRDLAGPSVRRIAEDPDGTMWFCSDRWPDPSVQGGLTSLKAGVWRKFTSAEGLPSDHVLNYFRASTGTQFALTTRGAARWDRTRWVPLGATGIPKGEEAWEMVESPKWGIFLHTQNHLLRWNGSEWERHPKKLSPLCISRTGDVITFLAEDDSTFFHQWNGKGFDKVAMLPRVHTYAEFLAEGRDGSVWALGYNNLIRWSRRGSEWTEYTQLPAPTVIDSKDRVWFPGDTASMSFDGEKTEWTEHLSRNIALGGNGTLWSWSPDGTVTVANGITNRFTTNEVGLRSIEKFVIDRDKNPWAVGKDFQNRAALSIFTNQGWALQPVPELESRVIFDVQADPRGGVWLMLGGTNRDLVRINGTTTRHQIPIEFTTHGDPQFCVSQEGLWLFGNFGLHRLKEGSPAQWERVPNIHNNVFGAMVGTHTICFLFDGNTGGRSGYLFYRDGSFTAYPADVTGFRTILADGHFLVSEGKGITILDPTTQKRVQHLTVPRETAISSAVRRSNGELWLTDIHNSILRYRPDELAPATQIKDAPRSLEQSDRLRVKVLAAQKFRPQTVTANYDYSWRFNNEPWSDFGRFPQEGLAMNALGAGTHVLEVRSRDEGLHVDPVGAKVRFEVLPIPLQQQPWFWPLSAALVVIALGSAALAVRRARAYKSANASLREEMQEREAAQRALLEERRLLDALMNSVPDKIFFKDKEGKFLRVNSAMAEMFRVNSPSDLLGKSDFDFFTEEEAKLGFADEQQIIRTGVGLIGKEEAFRNAQGTSMWISATKMPLRNASGNIVGIVGISRDITGRKEAEIQIERQRAEYETIFDSVPALVLYKDANNRILRANKYSAQFWGRTASDIVGLSLSDLDKRRGAALDEADLSVIRFGNPLFGTLDEVVLPSGQSRWLRVDRIPYRDVNGLIIGVIIFAVDITERREANEALKKAKEELEVRVQDRTAELSRANEGLQREVAERQKIEDELRRAEGFLKSVLENLPTAVFIKDAKELRFVLMNKINQELTGCTEEQVLGKCDSDLFDAQQAAFFMAMDREVIATGKLKQTEELLDTPHHGQRILLTKKIPVFNKAGEPEYLVGISEDITDRRLAELELKKAKDTAEEASRAKSDFLANMSHEIRTPMNAIIGMTNLLLDTDLNHEQGDYVETVRCSGEALLTIINDILDFSKIESGKLTFEHIPFDLRDVVESSVDFLAERARAKQVELACLVEADVWTHVKGDPGRLRQVLANLISNAVKFTDMGEVFVRVSVARDGDEKALLRFEVKDSGIGIDPELQEILFQPFSQADTSTTRKYGGTGLGLVISKKLLTLMGGEIGVQSVRGQGSTFWFNVPLEKAAGAIPEFPADRLAGLRVLVVDDNETNRMVLRHQLSAWRMVHGLAPSGAEALAELRRAANEGNAYTLAILDMQMPEMDGMDLARAIKMDPALATTRTILLTSLGERLGPEAMDELGLSASLLKPIRQSELFNCLATVSTGGSLPTRQVTLPPTDHVRPSRPIRLLLVEDNAINQKVSVQQLRKLGYSPDVASNGKEAIEAWSAHPYDVILMDCQMPEMDGYEATRQIRLRESQLGQGQARPHVYVVALTANAMKGDREKCLESGMDDYISKPVRVADLEAAINRSFTGAAFPVSTKVASSETNAPLNPQTLKGLRDLACEGGFDPLAELAPLFIEDSKGLLNRIRAAVEQANADGIKHYAHALKGSSRNLGADRLGRLCESLEKQGLAANWPVAIALSAQIETELNLVHAAIEVELARNRSQQSVQKNVSTNANSEDASSALARN